MSDVSAPERRAPRDDAPRIALFVFEARDPAQVRAVLEAVPAQLFSRLCEVVVMEARPGSGPPPPRLPQALDAKCDLFVHRTPRALGYGAVRKAALEYALRRGFDEALFLRADVHPPERLADLLGVSSDAGRELVLGARAIDRRHPPPGAGGLLRSMAHRLTTGFQNRLLGLHLHDYHSSLRRIPVDAMRRIPFQLDSDDRAFDMQLVIQCRALGLPIREVEVPPQWREYASQRAGLEGILRGVVTALDYRGHQLHLSRRGRYLVDHGVHYTLKQSRSGSHMQIVERIAPGSRVLDLGCSQGLLARPLREKRVRVTGVDAGPGENLADELDDYFQRDLEEPLELPTGRVYDYVVSSDVIEHLRKRVELLRSARRFLKPGGRLIVSTPNIAIWFYRLSLLLGRFEYGPRGILDETHVHLFTRATFRREVERAGFTIIHEMQTALPFEVVFESTGRSRLVRGLAAAYHALARAWPALFAYQFILEAEITTLDDDATSRPAQEPPGSGS